MIHMPQNSDILSRVSFLAGSPELLEQAKHAPARAPFDDPVIAFLGDVSRILLNCREAKAFSDVITFAFWIRKASVLALKNRFAGEENGKHIRLGKGLAFHIAPSNVPVNFAYSLVTGLLTGNANVVRIPSKDFPQVDLIVKAIKSALEENEEIRPYVSLVRYERDKEINDLFSSIADVRLIWGGDQTISELRKSPVPSRTTDITFADRYSIAVIDSDSYMSVPDKSRVAEDFYNDTYFSDQNACTSPRIVVWTGTRIKEAQAAFWDEEHKVVERKYSLQAIQGVNKLTSSYLAVVKNPGMIIEQHTDNLIIRAHVPELSDSLMEYRENSGFFYEYDCENILDLVKICDDKKCQTVAYLGSPEMLQPLLNSGVKGIDRVVPIGKTMDFDLIWDGYDLMTCLTRIISVV